MAEHPPPNPTPILAITNMAMFTEATWRMMKTMVKAEAQNMADRLLTRFMTIGYVAPASVAPM